MELLRDCSAVLNPSIHSPVSESYYSCHHLQHQLLSSLFYMHQDSGITAITATIRGKLLPNLAICTRDKRPVGSIIPRLLPIELGGRMWKVVVGMDVTCINLSFFQLLLTFVVS
jgi:hypothetical protein